MPSLSPLSSLDITILHDDKRFAKIFEVLFEINEKANLLRGIVKEVI